MRLHLLQLLAVHYQEAWVKYARQGIASLRVLPKPQRRGRWLLVDVSIFAMHDAGTGIQRVVRSVAIELLRAPRMVLKSSWLEPRANRAIATSSFSARLEKTIACNCRRLIFQ